MSRVETLRLLRCLWVAWSENDLGERSAVRLGFTEGHAWRRCVRQLGHDDD